VVALALKAAGALLLATSLAAYALGWWRLRRLGHPPPVWRLAAYALGAVVVDGALVGLDRAADERFSVHMIQHLLLMMVAAPLLALGDPLPRVLWGLPRRARVALGALLRPGARLRQILSALTWLPVAGGLYVVTVWAWHVPALYDAAAEHETLHAVEHMSFLATALLFWWPVLQPAPRLHPRTHPGLQIVYLVAATAQNTALGMVLSVPDRAFYPHYVRLAASLGIDAVDDQAFGGGLMWSMGHMYLLPIFTILYAVSRQGEREDGVAPTRPG
jgi:cytochrome c oxidase assembly factor CtaG